MKLKSIQSRISEAEITKQIRQYLNLKGIFHWKQFQTLGSKAGVSDIIGILPDGRFLAIEVKIPRGRVSPYQQEFLDQITKSNGIAIIARSVDDVIEVIDKYLETRKGGKI